MIDSKLNRIAYQLSCLKKDIDSLNDKVDNKYQSVLNEIDDNYKKLEEKLNTLLSKYEDIKEVVDRIENSTQPNITN